MSEKFETKIQTVADGLCITPLTKEEKEKCDMAIKGSSGQWYSFADILEEMFKRINKI